MSMEEFIKEQTKEAVEIFRDTIKNQGQEFTDVYEYIFRSGISYGIIIASKTLNEAPVGITFFGPDKEVKKNDNLLTFEDYKKSHEMDVDVIEDLIKSWSKPKCKCPCCDGGKMRKDTSVVLTTYPPQYKYVCDTCGHVENLDF